MKKITFISTIILFAFVSTANAQMVVDTFHFTGSQQIFVKYFICSIEN